MPTIKDIITRQSEGFGNLAPADGGAVTFNLTFELRLDWTVCLASLLL